MKIYILTNPELGWDNIIGVSTTRVGCIMDYTDEEKNPSSEANALDYARINKLVFHEKIIYNG